MQQLLQCPGCSALHPQPCSHLPELLQSLLHWQLSLPLSWRDPQHRSVVAFEYRRCRPWLRQPCPPLLHCHFLLCLHLELCPKPPRSSRQPPPQLAQHFRCLEPGLCLCHSHLSSPLLLLLHPPALLQFLWPCRHPSLLWLFPLPWAHQPALLTLLLPWPRLLFSPWVRRLPCHLPWWLALPWLPRLPWLPQLSRLPWTPRRSFLVLQQPLCLSSLP
mmetsp:Transcript_4687/g.8360  ORF Transcript_4687/g.8360 Transcript_4687/m.8360 type:complete len:217 (-) Transcript_4687:820-1470(-)